MVGLEESTSIYKALRTTQVVNSEKTVAEVLNVIENEYINPFGLTINKEKLLNLSSGEAVEENLTEDILSTIDKGKELEEKFRVERLVNKFALFHDTLKKNQCKTFNEVSKKMKVKSKSGAQKIIEVNRDILSMLTSYSLRTNAAIDFKKALEYSLSPIPLSICNADGSRRKTQKAKLKEVIYNKSKIMTKEEFLNIPKDVVVIDMVAMLNTIVNVPKTYNELALQFVKKLPKNYGRIDIVADSYKENSLKREEQEKRGQSEKVQISSLQSKIVSDFHYRILRNSDNKQRLIDLVFEYIKLNSKDCLTVLKSKKIVLSSENECTVVEINEENTVTIYPHETLFSTQEEADTKLILHANHILESTMSTVTIRSPSGDTDIVIIAIAVLNIFKGRVVLDDGHGKSQKQVSLSDINLPEEIITALIGFHSFTGNDYTSSFFRKGKQLCYKILENNSKFQAAMSMLGEYWDLSEDVISSLEEYTCRLYNVTVNNLDIARHTMFKKKHNYQNKSVDMSTLPPCKSVFRLHCLRANYIASIWKKSTIAKPTYPSIQNHGWDIDGSVVWVQEAFPFEIEEILLANDINEEEVLDDECLSDDEDF